MRTYTVALVALAIQAPPKWVDNLLSQHPVLEGVPVRRQGLARRISHRALIHIAVVRQLNHELGLSVADAVSAAPALLSLEGGGVLMRGHLRLSFDAPALERDLLSRLRDALESAPSPCRGRPRKRSTGM